ncbi:proline-rich protein [Lactarius hatsudake]|nr:proline-rich protein [Lactarius hatsudake]
MVQLSTILFALTVAGSVTAAPAHLSKRIAQVISASTPKWEAACDTAGGGQQCNSIAVTAFGTLLAAAGPCDQQDNADIMMDLSKKLNSPDMIKFAQIFAQQPRNTPNSVSVEYCQKAPRNAELNGLFQCQFQGADPVNFTNGLKAGDAGTIPFGQTAVLNPAGSCPAHTSGPIADGTQLADQVSSPGVPSGSGSNNNAPPAPSPTSPKAAAKGFAVLNGQDAQALNEKFKTLTADSSCTDGENACVGGDFAQCVGGKFVTSPCSGSTCVALPLVNSRGTSVTCDTQADADARIANALGTGGA